MLTLLKRTWKDFTDDECPVRAAALAYYTIFALPPLLVLLLMIAGLVWDPGDVRHAMEGQFAALVGQGGARAIHGMIAQADRAGGGRGVVATVLGAAGLLIGATGAFLQLQSALNRAWEVEPDPKAGGVRNFVVKRLLSLGMILGVAFLLIVSLALSAVLSLIGDRMGGAVSTALWQGINAVASFAVITVVFAAIFKVLPDAEIAWNDVWVGAIATSLLFVIGKVALGLYLGRSNPGQAFGAASALAFVLVWTYYTAMIVLFGAEFTQAWAQQRGRGIRPEEGAVRTGDAARRTETFAPDQRGMTMERQAGSRTALRPAGDGNGNGRFEREQSVGELFRRLSTDSTHLIRQEINLAKVELRASLAGMVKGAGTLGAAAAVAIPGLLAFTAFCVIGLGDLIDNYWLSALIVSAVFLGVAGIMAKRGTAQMKEHSLAPEQTIGTLREDAEWAKEESQAFKREFTASHARRA